MSNQITVFTAAHCPFCIKAKSLLSELLVRVQGDGNFWTSSTSPSSHAAGGGGHPFSPTRRLSLRGDPISPPGLANNSMPSLMRRVPSNSSAHPQPLGNACHQHGSTPIFSSMPQGTLCGTLPPFLEEESGKWKLVEISLTDYPERRSELLQLCNSLSLPQIFFNNYRVGGWEDLERLANEGKLEALLNDCEDSFEYREAPPVSREAWEEREFERGHLRRVSCRGFFVYPGLGVTRSASIYQVLP